jgi:FixJ family two-component response regulator
MHQTSLDSSNTSMEQGCDTVFVVDDDPLLRRQLELTLGLAGFTVVTFASAQQFLASVTAQHRGCVLTDIRMPGMSGLQLQEELVRCNSCMPVIVITGHADVALAVRAMRAGALDILEKPFRNEDLLAQLRSALCVARERAERRMIAQGNARKLSALSEREREVLQLVINGHSSSEVASLLGISRRTVDIHRARIMEKMGTKSLAALVRMVGAIR